jgi:hypothetical protein
MSVRRLLFVREVLDAQPDPWQVEALRALAKGHTRIALRSGHGVGKGCMAAWVKTWFANTRAPFEPTVSAPQLFDALWPEILKWFAKLPEPWRPMGHHH